MSKVNVLLLLQVLLILSLSLSISGEEIKTDKKCRTIEGVTYNPFAYDATEICLPKEQVVKDMEIIAGFSNSVRIYSIATCPENTYVIFDAAKKYNLSILLGIYITIEVETIQKELDLLPKLLTKYHKNIKGITVGNDALSFGQVGLRKKLKKGITEQDRVTAMMNYVGSVRKISSKYKIPIGVAEKWTLWESPSGNRLEEILDFVCLNMHPYYEGFSVDCKGSKDPGCVPAGEYVNLKAVGLSDYFNKPVWICETGWPTDGEKCCDGKALNTLKGFLAKPSKKNAGIFLEDFLNTVDGNNYYIQSAFDKDWRRVWDSCNACYKKSAKLFKNGICDLCEQEYTTGFYDKNKKLKNGYIIPKSSCTSSKTTQKSPKEKLD